MPRRLRVLIVQPVLLPGGAEVFLIRLAQALRPHCDVTLYLPYHCSSAAALGQALEGLDVCSIPFPSAWFHRAFYKLSLVLARWLGGWSLENWLHTRVLRALQQRQAFDLVSTHCRAATLMACRAFPQAPPRLVETDHGDYELLLCQDPQLTQHAALASRLDGLVYLSEFNRALLDRLPWQRPPQMRCIPNGLPQEAITPTRPPRDHHAFVFGMVARGTPEKGWTEALAAFHLVRARITQPVKLLFVGSGPCLDELQAALPAEERAGVEFAGFQAHPADWIQEFDIGLLPSQRESLPNALVECMAQGKPVIATDVGAIRSMIETPQGSAGMLVPLTHQGRADVASLAEAMEQLATNPRLRNERAQCAQLAAEKFRIEPCVAAYEQFFTELAA